MKPIITLQLMVDGVLMAVDAIDINLNTKDMEFCLIAPDDDREYHRLVKALGEHSTITRWTDPNAKGLNDVRIVGVGTMQVRWCADMFGIHSVTPYVA